MLVFSNLLLVLQSFSAVAFCCHFQWCHIVAIQIRCEFDVTQIRPWVGGLPHLEWLSWQTLTPAERVNRCHRHAHVNVMKLETDLYWQVGYLSYLGSPTSM